MNYKELVLSNLEFILKTRNIGIVDFLKSNNIKQSTFYAMKNGKSIKLDQIEVLANALNISVSELLKDRQQPEPEQTAENIALRIDGRIFNRLEEMEAKIMANLNRAETHLKLLAIQANTNRSLLELHFSRIEDVPLLEVQKETDKIVEFVMTPHHERDNDFWSNLSKAYRELQKK